MGKYDQFTRADRLLEAALDLPTKQRAAYLERECGDDGDLRALIERLLRRVEDTTTGEIWTGGAVGGLPTGSFGESLPDLTGASIDRYHIVKEIGRGGMGVVYEARDGKLDRAVAIKVLPVVAIDPRVRDRFLREARAAAALNHPSIVAIHDAGETDGRPYLVMEFVAGRSLDEHPPESLAEAIEIAGQVCEALEHAHGRDLVHRDLKPGNVLLIRGGGTPVAKLTDMGIALARGSSRITLTGAISGTPAYMAPEQALGRDVDGRADLYSLGVMLYQWAAGRPPFEGDDGLAVVSQHIHAPVVPPRTYRPDLPGGLEPVILKLLSKSPHERYSSASEVREALAAVGTDRAMTTPPRRVEIDGLTRGRMVGRREELRRVQELWRAALHDTRSHMALISGEPGVGKTRLAYELTSTAQLDGALVLSGGCYENEATTPYLPFLEAFRRVVNERDDTELADALGDTAAEIARLAPEIDSRLGPFPVRASLPPQEERLRLFDHVARFLRRLSARRGLLLFIDDLQWADHGSLALLHYLLRQLGAERILFLGTYREVELDRTHALSKSLVDWNREHLATRVRLDRLDRDATARMVSTMLGQRECVSGEFITTLHDETEGNPFFVEEIVKALIAEGGLVHENATWQRRDTGEFVMPHSVKAAIGSRLERIGATCSEVLRTAAVLGKHFGFDELTSVATHSEDDLLDALDEAITAQLISTGRDELFEFTHDKIREVLYDELNPIRRRRLHGRIAAGLEALQDQGSTVAVEDLAHHFVNSGDYAKGQEYAERAAGAATAVYAYDEALEMLARARECAEALELPPEVARIDEAMGDAAFAQGDAATASNHYERALLMADGSGPRNTIRCKLGESYVVSGDPRGRECVEAALAELDPTSSPHTASHAMMIQARFHHIAGELEEAAEIYRRAIVLAEPLGDAHLMVRLLSFMSGTLQHTAELEESLAFARRCVEIGERQSVPVGVMLGYEFQCEDNFYLGRLEESLHFGEMEEAMAAELHAGDRYAWSHIRVYALHWMGRHDDAERLSLRGIEHCERTGDRRLELFLRFVLGASRVEDGRGDDGLKQIVDAIGMADELGFLSHRFVGRSFLAYALIRLERFDDAVRVAREGLDLWIGSGAKGSALIHGPDLAEAMVLGGDLEQARRALDLHLELAVQNDSAFRLGQNLRVRALLAAREGRTEEAIAGFEAAIPKLEACGARGEARRARVQLSDTTQTN